jgi:general secretion pathway protein L
MQESLVIYLHAKNLDHPSWILFDEEGMVKENQFQGKLEDLLPLSINRYVQVCVPAQDVLLTQTILQKMPRSRLRQVLPYALEEQLIDEIDQLHFAIGEEEAGSLSVAIVSHVKMHEWSNLLTTLGLKPNEMISFIHFLPEDSDTWHIMWLDELMCVRTSSQKGFAADPINLPALLELMLAEIKTTEHPKKIIYYADQPILPANLTLPHEIKIEYQAMPPQECLRVAGSLSRQKKSSQAINLLQGAYAIKHPGLYANYIFKIGTYLLTAWIGLILAYPVFSYILLKTRINGMDKEIAAIYQYHFPNAANVIAPKLRMTDKLKKLQIETSQQPLFTYLNYLAEAKTAVPAITLKRMTYQEDQLILDVTAPASTDLSSFTNSLTQHGAAVKQQNANFTGSEINATLLIE